MKRMTHTKPPGVKMNAAMTETATVAKAKTTTTRKLAKRKNRPASQKANASVQSWATFGVVFTLLISAMLNGYANAQHAPVALAGWLMGLSIPVLVLVLAKVSGEKYRTGQMWICGLSAASGAALLALSVWHCANSISLLTGSGIWLAVPMAVAIDCGLVACEIALISEPRK